MINVLIAEDDFRVAGIHEKFLSGIPGVQLSGKALNGQEAIRMVHDKRVDLVLLDIYMPDALGTDLINQLREIRPGIDVIMISAATEKVMIEESIKKGIFDYIIKPVKMDRFVATIEKYKRTKNTLHNKEEIDQTFLDEYFGHHKPDERRQSTTPKGIDPLTLKNVKDTLDQNQKGITAEAVGREIGASRTTARRYLEYLISTDEAHAELEYGIVGRPERKYKRNGQTS